MALLSRGYKEDIIAAGGAARWLITCRNSAGGFLSTQDTAVALDALSRYQSKVSKPPTNLTITVSSPGSFKNNASRLYRIRDMDKLQTKQIALSRFSDSIMFNITGYGCVILQVRYFLQCFEISLII